MNTNGIFTNIFKKELFVEINKDDLKIHMEMQVPQISWFQNIAQSRNHQDSMAPALRAGLSVKRMQLGVQK